MLITAFSAVLKALDTSELDIKTLNPSQLIEKLSEILEDSMGGTIGAREYFPLSLLREFDLDVHCHSSSNLLHVPFDRSPDTPD